MATLHNEHILSRRTKFGEGCNSLWQWCKHKILYWLTSGRMARFWQDVMSLSDADRSNVAKAFDYLDTKHFQAHADCVRRKIHYRWLIYGSTSALVEWEKYKKQLRDELGQADFDRLFKKCIECKAIPVDPKVEPWIPFRITMFGEDICLCGSESKRLSYRVGKDTISLDPGTFHCLMEMFNSLYDSCPFIEAVPEGFLIEDKSDPLVEKHKKLRREFIKHLTKNYGEDFPIIYAEAGLTLATLSLLVTLIPLFIMNWYVMTKILHQIHLLLSK